MDAWSRSMSCEGGGQLRARLNCNVAYVGKFVNQPATLRSGCVQSPCRLESRPSRSHRVVDVSLGSATDCDASGQEGCASGGIDRRSGRETKGEQRIRELKAEDLHRSSAALDESSVDEESGRDGEGGSLARDSKDSRGGHGGWRKKDDARLPRPVTGSPKLIRWRERARTGLRQRTPLFPSSLRRSFSGPTARCFPALREGTLR